MLSSKLTLVINVLTFVAFAGIVALQVMEAGIYEVAITDILTAFGK